MVKVQVLGLGVQGLADSSLNANKKLPTAWQP